MRLVVAGVLHLRDARLPAPRPHLVRVGVVVHRARLSQPALVLQDHARLQEDHLEHVDLRDGQQGPTATGSKPTPPPSHSEPRVIHVNRTSVSARQTQERIEEGSRAPSLIFVLVTVSYVVAALKILVTFYQLNVFHISNDM